MAPEQWEELVAQVEVHGPENIRFVMLQSGGDSPQYELGEPNDVRFTGNTINVEFI